LIYIKIEENSLPKKALDAARDAAEKLEAVAAADRSKFISDRDKLWKAFRDAFLEASNGKCWFSECKDRGALSDVDHFRPKSEAIRGDASYDDGYPWLAFDWRNFRLSAQLCNRLYTNPDTNIVGGKGAHFPLAIDSPKAHWDDRCEDAEQPILLDPTCPADVELVTFDADGLVSPTKLCSEAQKHRVEVSAKILNLDLPMFKDGRREVMRQVQSHFLEAKKCLHPRQVDLKKAQAANEVAAARSLTQKDRPFSRAAEAEFQRQFVALG
jgi:hypothetical protein